MTVLAIAATLILAGCSGTDGSGPAPENATASPTDALADGQETTEPVATTEAPLATDTPADDGATDTPANATGTDADPGSGNETGTEPANATASPTDAGNATGNGTANGSENGTENGTAEATA